MDKHKHFITSRSTVWKGISCLLHTRYLVNELSGTAVCCICDKPVTKSLMHWIFDTIIPSANIIGAFSIISLTENFSYTAFLYEVFILSIFVSVGYYLHLVHYVLIPWQEVEYPLNDRTVRAEELLGHRGKVIIGLCIFISAYLSYIVMVCIGWLAA